MLLRGRQLLLQAPRVGGCLARHRLLRRTLAPAVSTIWLSRRNLDLPVRELLPHRAACARLWPS